MRLNNLFTIKKRKEFLFAAKCGISMGRRSIFVQAAKEELCNANNGVMRVGFTVSKKVGNAVKRNKVKRQFRVLAQQVLPQYCNKDYYYILMGNSYTSKNCFKNLYRDLVFCLKALNLYSI